MVRFDENRGFGIEIEVRPFQIRRTGTQHSISRRQIERWLNSIDGVEAHAEGYNHATRPYWKIVSDVTCGWEVVSPILRGTHGLEQAKAVVRKLKAHGAIVDHSTGLHVHHGIEGITVQQLANIGTFYAKFQGIFNQLVADHRRNNRWAAGMLIYEMKSAMRQLKRYGFNGTENSYMDVRQAANILARRNGGRYKALNYVATLHHGTVEFRQKEGVLDPEVVEAWIVFTQMVVTKSILSPRKESPTQLRGSRALNPIKAMSKYLKRYGKWTALERKAWATLITAAQEVN